MSFDLMVFEPGAAPSSSPEEFLAWYDGQTEWSEDHHYDDPAVCSELLRMWLTDIVSEFPMMNGPLAAEVDEDHPSPADYSIGKYIIYAAFLWSSADAAHERVFALARKYKLGFFDITAHTGGVWLPTKDGGYEIVLTADDLHPEEAGYGLFVFDPDQAPNEQEPFIEWCVGLQDQLHLTADAKIDAKLQPWFIEITNSFPFACELGNADMETRVTEYYFLGPGVFALFPEAHADEAYETVLRLAKTRALGVHVMSSQGDVWLPTSDGGHEVAFRVPRETDWADRRDDR